MVISIQKHSYRKRKGTRPKGREEKRETKVLGSLGSLGKWRHSGSPVRALRDVTGLGADKKVITPSTVGYGAMSIRVAWE